MTAWFRARLKVCILDHVFDFINELVQAFLMTCLSGRRVFDLHAAYLRMQAMMTPCYAWRASGRRSGI
jgi:hypothetical protein